MIDYRMVNITQGCRRHVHSSQRDALQYVLSRPHVIYAIDHDEPYVLTTVSDEVAALSSRRYKYLAMRA